VKKSRYQRRTERRLPNQILTIAVSGAGQKPSHENLMRGGIENHFARGFPTVASGWWVLELDQAGQGFTSLFSLGMKLDRCTDPRGSFRDIDEALFAGCG